MTKKSQFSQKAGLLWYRAGYACKLPNFKAVLNFFTFLYGKVCQNYHDAENLRYGIEEDGERTNLSLMDGLYSLN